MNNPSRTSLKPIQPESFRSILLDHNHRYPRWQIQDVYKLIHQAAKGSEHALKDVPTAQKMMERELAIMEAGLNEPVQDPLRSDLRILRIHLRPYLARGGDLQKLVEAFVATANLFKSSPDDFMVYWALAHQMAQDGMLPFNPRKLDDWFDRMSKEDFPASDHSNVFEDLYRPAYRVISSEFLPLLNLSE